MWARPVSLSAVIERGALVIEYTREGHGAANGRARATPGEVSAAGTDAVVLVGSAPLSSDDVVRLARGAARLGLDPSPAVRERLDENSQRCRECTASRAGAARIQSDRVPRIRMCSKTRPTTLDTARISHNSNSISQGHSSMTPAI